MARVPMICACCREYIFPGNYYTEFDNKVFCNANCMSQELVAQATQTDYREFVEEYFLNDFKEYLMESAEYSHRYYHTDEEMRAMEYEE